MSIQQVATDAFGNALGWSLADAPGQPIQVAPTEERSARYFAPFKPLERGPGVQLAQAEIHLGDVWNAGGVHMQAPVFDWSRMDNPGEVNVSATRTDWTNPFADATLSAAQWTVSNITNVARGATVPQTYTNAQLVRPAQGPSSVNALQRSGSSPEAAGIEKSRSKALPTYLQIPGGPERYTVPSDTSRVNGLTGYLLDKLDSFNNSPIGMSLQGLPPEGLAIGGIKAGLRWLGKTDNIGDALKAEQKLIANAESVATNSAATLSRIEGRFADASREVGFIVDSESGAILGVRRSGIEKGTQISLDPIKDYPLMKGNVFTHNHPLIGNLSPGDVSTALGSGTSQFRAVTSTRVTSISFSNAPKGLIGEPAASVIFMNGEKSAIGATYRAGIANGSLVPPLNHAEKNVWMSDYFIQQLTTRNLWIKYSITPR